MGPRPNLKLVAELVNVEEYLVCLDLMIAALMKHSWEEAQAQL